MVFLAICTALYDYSPQSDSELPLQEGDLVYVLEKSTEDDWWKAKKRAANDDEEEPVGLIPNNYVEEANPTHHAKALYDYNRQTDEELSFSEEAILSVYDTGDPEWTLVGLDDEYGFAPANYIEITGKAEQTSVSPPTSAQASGQGAEPEPQVLPSAQAQSGPAAAIAGIMQNKSKSPSVDSPPPNLSLPPRKPQLTPDDSDEEPAAPSLPRRPPSQQLSPPPTQYASPRSPDSPGVAASPPYNRAVSQNQDKDRPQPNAGGFHLYNINEVVSAMGKNKKLPTTLGLNLATGVIMIAPEKSRDGPQMEWTADKLTHYSIEGKHVFMELIRPSKSVDFHAGAKDTAHEIVSGLGEMAGAARAEGLREIIDAGSGGGGMKKGKIAYDFMAQGDDEVTVAVGDDVVVLDDTKSDEWWMVRRLKNNTEGVVPSSYVEVTGIMPPPRTSSGINAGKSVVEQNRLEEDRLTKEAAKNAKGHDAKSSEVGPDLKVSPREDRIALGNRNNSHSQRTKKESKHGRSSSSSKSKPDMTKTRTWTDRSGTFKVEAQFIGLKDGKIHLHKLNGVKIAVPVVKMAIEDLEYVEKVTGISLDDDKPLSDIRRRSTQTAKDNDRKKSQASGATVQQPKSGPPKPDVSEYDWFDFFLKAGVSPYQCERYAFNFNKDSMDENILADITPQVLRTLGLKEGDILRVMRYLDIKFGRTGISSPDNAEGGLFSGPGGALRNNTRKGRPAPAVQSDDVVDASKFSQRSSEREKPNDRKETPLTQAPAPPTKDTRGFDDNAWDVKPSKQSAQQPAPKSTAASPPPAAANAPPPQATLTGSLVDLSLLSEPLQPEKVQPPPPIQPQQTQAPPPAQNIQPQQLGQQQQHIPQQPTGANPSFFSQLGQQPNAQQSQQQNASQTHPPQTFGLQQNFQPPQQLPQSSGFPRQRPQAPQQPPGGQQGALMPPPPARPLSAPQTQPQNSSFGLPPLQPQLTGYQPQTHVQSQIAPPGQSLNDLNQQRLQQQQQQQFAPQPLQPHQTGYGQQPQGFNQFNNGIIPQQTGFGQQFGQFPQQQSGLQGMQNPYVNGQQAGSPFADPRSQQQTSGFQPIQPQNTGFQPQFQAPQQTGINSMLPPALQPQPTGVNGFSRPAFGQAPPPVPPMPPMPQQEPAAAPLQPQKTGPAPPVRFGAPAANKLVPQRTGRANLAAATPSNPFGF
ncbi:cytoskeletal protein binding protein [Lecanora helva]